MRANLLCVAPGEGEDGGKSWDTVCTRTCVHVYMYVQPIDVDIVARVFITHHTYMLDFLPDLSSSKKTRRI